MISNTADLRNAFNERATRSGLTIDCPADGAFNAQIAVVAEAPGETECLKRLPLIGMSGQKLWQTFRPQGITRMDCYITNVAKRQVAVGYDKKRAMSKNEQDTWNSLLLWELSQLPNLKYVVALGNFALTALTGHSGITQWRGSVLSVDLPNGRTIKVICTYNPAMILREPKTEIMFMLDLKKVRRVMDGKHKVPEIITHINPTMKDAIDWIKQMRHGETPVSIDIETMTQETACVGLANNGSEAMCINWRTTDTNRYSFEEERQIRRELNILLQDSRVRFVAQNGMFDLTWLWFKDKMRAHSIWFDTMLAHHCLYPTLPHNLGFITTQYTDHPYYKDEKDEWRDLGAVDDYWRYNGKDCCITYLAYERMLRELEKAGLDQFFFNHVMRAQPTLARMTVGGVKLDMELKERIRDELIEDVSKRLADFHASVVDVTGDPDYAPNPRSPMQLSELFFRKLKLVGRGTSTDATNRQRIYNHPKTTTAHKTMLDHLNGYMTENKFLTTYADMAVDPDGHARCTYNQTGVQSAPGRLSSSKTLWGSGMNLQNQPSRAHPMFVAPEGYGLAYFDMAQAEARLVAYFADIPLWKEQFERARIDGVYDAHRALASEMFGIPYDEVPTDDKDAHGMPTLRFIAKRCRHGLNYRMQADRLAQTTGLIISEAHKAFNAYHRSTPELRPWWGRLEKEVRDTKTLYNAYGRRLLFLERLTPEALESIVAFKPQSTLGDHIVRVMYQSESDEAWPMNARMYLNVHDALIAVAPLGQIRTCLSIMKRYAEAPIVINGDELIIPADCAESKPDEHGIHRWSTLKKLKKGEIA